MWKEEMSRRGIKLVISHISTPIDSIGVVDKRKLIKS